MDILSYKVVLIGLGSIGKKHVNAMLQMQGHQFQLYALRRSASASQHPNVTNITTLEALESPPDFFIVSNPTFAHFETISAVLPFGKPIFIEKPAVMHLKEGQQLIHALAQQKMMTYVGCNLRFLDVLKFTKDYLKQQNFRINEVNIYGGSYMPDWRPQQNFRDIYSANQEMGGGIHLDFIHEIDYLYWFFGQPLQSHKILRSQSSLSISSIDYANYTFLYENFAASVILNYYRKDRKRSCEILTDRGTLRIEIEKNKAYFNDKLIFSSEQTILDTYTAQMQYFVQHISSERRAMNSFEESFDVLQMCLGQTQT